MLIACTSILSLFSSHLCFDQFIFTLCSLPYVHFHNSIYSSFSISLWFPENFGLFSCFSRLYVHFLLLGSVFLSGFSENFGLFSCFSRPYVHFLLLGSVFLSGFTFILDFFPVFLSFMSIWKNTEDSGPRKAALRRIKRSAITAFLFQKLLFRLP